MSEAKKYFWLRLTRDFFKRHDVRIIESYGKEYVLFYLKLLCESIDHEGNLRFSEDIPYTEEMLASITNTERSVAEKAIKALTDLKLMEVKEDGTFFLPKVTEMIGSETDWAKKKREYRDNSRTSEGQTEDIERTNEGQKKTLSDKSKRKSNSKSNSNSNSNRDKKFVPPTLEQIMEYCSERNNNVDPQKFLNHYQSNGWMVGRNHMKDWKAAVRTWENNSFDKPTSPKKTGNEFLELLNDWEDEDE